MTKTPLSACSLFSSAKTFKPFHYDFAHEAFTQHENSHWTPAEVNMQQDYARYTHLNPNLQHFIRSTMLFFTQGDIEIMESYVRMYFMHFKNLEVTRMLASIAARESTHVVAYALLQSSLGLADSEFSEFKNVEQIVNKISHAEENTPESIDSIEDMMKAVFVNSIFGEGVSLFSIFSVVYSIADKLVLQGLQSTTLWSIVDESQHVEFMTNLYNVMKECIPEENLKEVEDFVIGFIEKGMEIESEFIRWLLKGDPEREAIASYDDIMKYVYAVANSKVEAIGLGHRFTKYKGIDNTKNPVAIRMLEMTADRVENTFEVRGTSYDKSIDMSKADKLIY